MHWEHLGIPHPFEYKPFVLYLLYNLLVPMALELLTIQPLKFVGLV